MSPTPWPAVRPYAKKRARDIAFILECLDELDADIEEHAPLPVQTPSSAPQATDEHIRARGNVVESREEVREALHPDT